MTTAEDLLALSQRLRLVDESETAPAYDGLIEQARRFLDSLARAAPDEATVRELGDGLATLRTLADAFAADEKDRPFGKNRSTGDRAQCLIPGIRVRHIDDREYLATVNLGDYYLGMNGAAHGGVPPLLFDEVVGVLSSASASGTTARTAYLNTAYRAITPLGVDLEIRARVDRVEGRKRFISGELVHGEIVCVEVEALLVELRPGQP